MILTAHHLTVSVDTPCTENQEQLIRDGICPNCFNDSCMADGRTGLWCPNCDASYLLDGDDTAVADLPTNEASDAG